MYPPRPTGLGRRTSSTDSHSAVHDFQAMLADYTDPKCPFCGLISKCISDSWGTGWNAARLSAAAAADYPPELFIQSRSPLSVKRGSQTEYPEPRLLLAISERPPQFKLNRAPIRQIDRGQSLKRFIIAEIEALPNGAATLEAVRFLRRRHVGERVDVQLIKHWLDECREHGHTKKATTAAAAAQRANTLFQPAHSFRLIDVVDECLVQRSEECDYVALSYVWGAIPTILWPARDNSDDIPILLATRANVDELSIPAGLSRARRSSPATGRIPSTVRDAIELTQRIGKRYLWVDTLCIVQDDPDDKMRLIGRMDDIYDTALVTTVAAAGGDADAGLRGVSPRAGHPITPVTIAPQPHGTDNDPNISSTLQISICLPSLCDEVRKSNWNSRGWTFQEQSLSQRILYFTADEVFFNCAQSQRREGYDYGNERAKHASTGSIQCRTGPPWWSRVLRKDPDPTPYHYLGDVARRRIGKTGIEAYQKAVQDRQDWHRGLPEGGAGS